MKHLKFGTVLLCAFSLSGCFVSESKHQESIENLNSQIKLLRSHLGEFQYISLDPQNSVSIKDVKFIHPENNYSSPKVKFKASLKQMNNDFPIDTYRIIVSFQVLDEMGNEVAATIVSSEVENGVLSLAEEKSLYGLKSSKLVGYKLKVSSISWSPILRFKVKENT